MLREMLHILCDPSGLVPTVHSGPPSKFPDIRKFLVRMVADGFGPRFLDTEMGCTYDDDY
jgi:hypothetical protein